MCIKFYLKKIDTELKKAKLIIWNCNWVRLLISLIPIILKITLAKSIFRIEASLDESRFASLLALPVILNGNKILTKRT